MKMKRVAFLVTFALSTMLLASLMTGSANAADTKYRLPLASNPGYYAWFDHNSSGGKLLRFDCITSFSYDNHQGTDFRTALGTSIFAGARGNLYYTVNTCPDDGSQPSCGGSYGNHARMVHADGRVTIYAHMKKGTVMPPLNNLSCGSYLGKSGNSGRSSAPHLHFELWLNTGIGKRIDFYGGSCNSPSFWVNQNGMWPTTQCQ
jgi:murein DD-endopeptidase MepM/ murein hydrolase activator NlpD